MASRQPSPNGFHASRNQRPRRAEWLTFLPLLSLALTTLVPTGEAAFTEQASNVGNTFAAAGSFCPDTDGDGLGDCWEDANTDGDGNPATNPGPDTDGDTTPNYLDADDDGDGLLTSAENADPNGDGDPRDALDSDRDGQPDYLDAPITAAAGGSVSGEQKISDTVGGLVVALGNGDGFGSSVSSLGDVDGDGVADLAVGAPYDDDGGTDHGAVYVLFMNTDGTVKAEQKISDTTGGLASSLGFAGRFGHGVAALGDIDGDGVPDVAVGSHNDDDGGTDYGAVYVLFLNTDGTVKAEQKISAVAGGLSAVLGFDDNFGIQLASPGDVDGDGINDLAVGARGDDDGASDAGAVYLLFLNADGTVKAEQKISNTAGGLAATLDSGDSFGRDVAGPGDVDGDGVPDLVAAAEFDDDGGSSRGAVHVLFLNANGTVKAEQKISNTAGGLSAALDDGDIFGIGIGPAGDLDLDGVPDLVVAANQDDDGGLNRGATYVLYLNSNGTVKSEAKISSTAGGLTGPLDDNDNFGVSLTGLGDLDGDGAIDIVAGARGDDDGGTDRGAIYILDLSP